MAIFYTADLHLGHTNIISSCRRPYVTVDEMNTDLVRRWNSRVDGNDDVYILGDLSYRSDVHVSSYLKRMKGKKYLIKGNHDQKWGKNFSEEMLRQYFEFITDMTVIRDGKNFITLCHYPMLSWNRSRYATKQDCSTSWLVHGHIHNDRECAEYKYIKDALPCALNAGVDINGFQPVTFQELIENNNMWYGRK